jgi:hypothetical protein
LGGYFVDIKTTAPYWIYTMHDSFQLNTNIWGGFMDECPEPALDMHIYQVWHNPDRRLGYFQDACTVKWAIGDMEREFGLVIVGKWSLLTDNCCSVGKALEILRLGKFYHPCGPKNDINLPVFSHNESSPVYHSRHWVRASPKAPTFLDNTDVIHMMHPAHKMISLFSF